jgi:hypothetical protein
VEICQLVARNLLRMLAAESNSHRSLTNAAIFQAQLGARMATVEAFPTRLTTSGADMVGVIRMTAASACMAALEHATTRAFATTIGGLKIKVLCVAHDDGLVVARALELQMIVQLANSLH